MAGADFYLRIFAGFHTDLNFLTIHGQSRYPGCELFVPLAWAKLIVSEHLGEE